MTDKKPRIKPRIRVWSHDTDLYDDIVQQLRKFRVMVREYQACKAEYDLLFPSCTPMLTGMPQAESVDSITERWVQRRLDIRDIMERSLAAMQDEYVKIAELMRIPTGDLHAVLIRRYDLGESWETIARHMQYCERQVRRIHERAVWSIVQAEKK